ncbi:MAG TPA: hypothetical protein VG848_15375 [Acetobacteraceae bacterium]|jgi:hypothetical protein|nr:hypothetical protein [Acetobacteraceae bacterium]
MWKFVRAKRTISKAEPSVAMEQLRRIASTAREQPLSGEETPHPDAELLEFCAEISHQRKIADAAWRRFTEESLSLWCTSARADALYGASRKETQRLDFLLREAGKLRAKTGAGIYAKALAITRLRNGGLGLCKSLAEDLIASPALRATLWGAEPEAAAGPGALSEKRRARPDLA